MLIQDITPYPSNPRDNNQTAVDKVAQSIKEFGFNQPIVVDKNNVIIAGHTRYMAAHKLGLDDVPVVVANHLTDDQARAYRIADNRVAQESTWDDSLLLQEISALDENGDLFNELFVGFDPDELARILDPITDVTDADDEAPAVDMDSDADSKLGEMYELGPHRLMCGDSTSEDDLNALMGGEKAEMLFTDPPYGYSYESNHQKKHSVLINDDIILDFMKNAYLAMADNAAAYVCGSHQTINIWRDEFDKVFDYKNLIVWKKNNWSMGDLNGSFAGQHELILFGHKGRVELRGERTRDVWEFDRDPPRLHPTQKPIELVSMALTKTSDIGSAILDLFGGSGSTLIACAKTKRICRMMEISPHYCDVIRKRWTTWATENGQDVGSGGLE